MMSHTPGPWRVGGSSGNTGEAEEIVAGLRVIAWTADTYNDEEDDGEVTDEDRANARLIAAAPELLAALKAHLPWQDEPVQGWGCWADAVAAINKAEGRSE